MTDITKRRYHRIDGWRGYSIPAYAVAGASDTGTWDDSPAPSDQVLIEIATLRRFLRKAGIKTRLRWGTSSNVFMAKRWLVIEPESRDKANEALQLTTEWLEQNDNTTRYIHDAT